MSDVATVRQALLKAIEREAVSGNGVGALAFTQALTALPDARPDVDVFRRLVELAKGMKDAAVKTGHHDVAEIARTIEHLVELALKAVP